MAERRQPARMQVIEVDEAERAPDRPVAPERPQPDAPQGERGLRSLLRSHRWAALVAAVAALALVVAWQLGAAHDRAYVRHVESVPGMVHPLDGPPHAAWAAPALGLSTTMEVADGRLVLVEQQGAEYVVRAHDPATGATAWSVGAGRSLGGDTEGPDVRCPWAGLDVGSLVVCLVTPARSLYATPQGRSHPPATTVLALAASNGHAVGRWSVTDAVADAVRVGDDVALLTYDGAGFMGVQLRDARTGAVRWHYRSDDGLDPSQATPATSLRLEQGRLVVQGAGTLVLVAATGRVLLDEPSLQNVVVVPVGDGLATWRIGEGWQVAGPDGRTRYRLQGMPVMDAVDDGTSHNLLITDSGDTVRGQDPTTGTTLWISPMSTNVVARVAHRLVIAGDDRFGVADPRTGAVVWEHELNESLPWTPLSDGALVLAPGLSGSGRSQLVAYHLADGVQSWSVELPERVLAVVAVGGLIVAQTTTGVVVYR
jgi:outer membrane protein assembly factor BamB